MLYHVHLSNVRIRAAGMCVAVVGSHDEWDLKLDHPTLTCFLGACVTVEAQRLVKPRCYQ